MELTRQTEINQVRLVRLQEMLEVTLDQVLHRGFFGSATIGLVIQDGTIQRTNRTIEEIDKK